jgi:hypothetical protein
MLAWVAWWVFVHAVTAVTLWLFVEPCGGAIVVAG